MNVYLWDAGVIIGYVTWAGVSFRETSQKIDPLSENCDRFVHSVGINSENHIPNNAQNEVRSRLEKNSATFMALIELIRTERFTPNNYIDASRLLSFKMKFEKSNRIDVINALIHIQSTILSRKTQVYTCCKLKSYAKRLDTKEENKIRQLFQKQGDLLNFSATIHFHNNEKDCIFITTDKHDFGSVDFSTCGLNYKIPPIEFIQDY
jgi:hypothetical protein